MNEVICIKIFISHASQFKPVVKTMLKYMPPNILTWLDENNLVWGDQLAPAFEKAIKTQADYVVIFINELAGRSEWVRKELFWALERERELKRIFVLPVFLRSEGDCVPDYFPELKDRKSINITDYTEFGLKTSAELLTASLFSLICEDLNRMQNPEPVKITETIDLLESTVTKLAQSIQTAIFPHRKENPITVEELCAQMQGVSNESFSQEEFDNLLNKIIQRNLIPGLAYDGYELYLVEEHSLWKATLNHENKVRIARKATSYIKSGMKVYIDAGSTTEQVVKILCKRIEMRTIFGVTIVTPSVNHADIISECCVKQGFRDDFTAVELYLPGGCVRPGTQAIVPLDGQNDLDRLTARLSGYDLAIIGANGVTAAGLTTHANQEVLGKKHAYLNARQRIFLCDDSKFGIELDHTIASFEDEFILITNANDENAALAAIMCNFPGKVVIAK